MPGSVPAGVASKEKTMPSASISVWKPLPAVPVERRLRILVPTRRRKRNFAEHNRKLQDVPIRNQNVVVKQFGRDHAAALVILGRGLRLQAQTDRRFATVEKPLPSASRQVGEYVTRWVVA